MRATGSTRLLILFPLYNFMIIETKRLILKEMREEHFDSLYEILSDSETMKFYPEPFDKERVHGWISWNIQNYRQYGFGLWTVILKETEEIIGDCGITMQQIDGDSLPEIGYHICKKYWLNGFAKEAASAVRDWFFRNTKHNTVFSYMKSTNIPSISTASSIGMKKVKEYSDNINGITCVYAVSRDEYEKNPEI